MAAQCPALQRRIDWGRCNIHFAVVVQPDSGHYPAKVEMEDRTLPMAPSYGGRMEHHGSETRLDGAV